MKNCVIRMASFTYRALGKRIIGAANSPSATMVREARPEP